MRSARINLGYGIALTALGAGLCQFVMVGLIGLFILLIALYRFLQVIVFEYPEKQFSLPSTIFIKLSYIIGILSCMAVAFYTSSMTYNASVTAHRAIPIPFQMEWYTLLIIGLIPTFLISIGIYYQKKWSRIECLVWGLAAYLTAPASFVVFRVFSSLGFPLTA